MADLIASALDWLNGQLGDHASQPINYVRGDGTELAGIMAVIATPEKQPMTILGFSPTGHDMLEANPINVARDFSVLASDLAVNGVKFTPANNDQIIHLEDDGDLGIYEVMALQQGGLAWEFETGHRGSQARIVIHTRFYGLVGANDPEEIDLMRTWLLAPPFGLV